MMLARGKPAWEHSSSWTEISSSEWNLCGFNKEKCGGVCWEHGVNLVFFAELGWAQPCDVWSTGCILFEYYRGFTLFQVGFLFPENPSCPEGLRIR